MNVLLIFVFLSVCCSVLKDFIDSNWQWQNKNIFSILLSLFAFLPVLTNLIIFIKSDLNKLKEIYFNVYKFLFMYSFESWMTKRVLTGNGLYCNMSSIRFTEHYGGEMLKLTKNLSGNFELNFNYLYSNPFQSNLENFFSIFQIENLNLSEIPNNHYMMKFNFKDLNRQCRNEKSFDSMIKLVLLLNGFDFYKTLIDNGKSFFTIFVKKSESSIQFNIGEEIYVYSLDLSLFNYRKKGSGDLFEVCRESNFSVSNFSFEVSRRSLNNFNLDSNFQRLILNNNHDFQIGIMNLSLTNQSIKIFYSGKVIKLLPLNILGWNNTKFVLLIECLKFWSENPEKGICVDLEGYVRKGSTVLHCLKLEEIVKHLNDLYNIEFVQLIPKKYFVEGLIEDIGIEALGPKNFKTLNDLHFLFFKTDINKILLPYLLNLSSAIEITRFFKRKLPSHRLKSFLVHTNYFFQLIKYGNINYIDCKIPLKRDAVQICRSNEVIFKNLNKTSLNIVESCEPFENEQQTKILSHNLKRKRFYNNPGDKSLRSNLIKSFKKLDPKMVGDVINKKEVELNNIKNFLEDVTLQVLERKGKKLENGESDSRTQAGSYREAVLKDFILKNREKKIEKTVSKTNPVNYQKFLENDLDNSKRNSRLKKAMSKSKITDKDGFISLKVTNKKKHYNEKIRLNPRNFIKGSTKKFLLFCEDNKPLLDKNCYSVLRDLDLDQTECVSEEDINLKIRLDKEVKKLKLEDQRKIVKEKELEEKLNRELKEEEERKALAEKKKEESSKIFRKNREEEAEKKKSVVSRKAFFEAQFKDFKSKKLLSKLYLDIEKLLASSENKINEKNKMEISNLFLIAKSDITKLTKGKSPKDLDFLNDDKQRVFKQIKMAQKSDSKFFLTTEIQR